VGAVQFSMDVSRSPPVWRVPDATSTPVGSKTFTSNAPESNTANEILIRLTWLGDTDLDNDVDAGDYTAFITGLVTGTATWDTGDFDYDGRVTIGDFTSYLTGLNAYNGGTGQISSEFASNLMVQVAQGEMSFADLTAARPGPTAVPEPGSAALALGASALLMRRRRR
jgi:hypothetical protein